MINKLSRFKLHNNSLINIKFKKINNYFNLKSFATTNISSGKNYEKLKAELNFETDEDKDFKYEDQLFFLEREMNKLIKEKIEFGQDYATSDLPEYQQREVNSLVEIVKQFDLTEREYFFFTLKNYLEKNCDSRLSKQNSFLRKKNIVLSVDSTALNPNNEILDEILKPLIPYLAGELFVGGGAGGSGQETKKEVVKEEKKEEKPKEKTEYNIQITAFDATKKLNLIKEVRALLNLGLKEAKELVEKTPTELMKKVKSEEAKSIKMKLEENGAKIELL